MFTPFRNFITYIQKNTSGRTTTRETMEKEKEMLEETPQNTTTVVATTVATNASVREHIIPVKLLDDEPSKPQSPPAFVADDDIELQIKSSIMVKPAVIENSEIPTTPFNNGIRRMSIMRRPSISIQAATQATPFMPPKHLAVARTQASTFMPPKHLAVARPTQTASPPSPPPEVEQEIEVETEKNDKELNDSFETAESEPDFLDISLPEIPNCEIIVLNCVENELSTESPTPDPLALEQPLNTSSTTNSSCGELAESHDYWLGTEELHSINAANEAVCDNQAISVAEEVRSEGSDSGLGTDGQIPKAQPRLAESEPTCSSSSPPSFAIQQPLRSNLKRRSDICNTDLTDGAQKRAKRSITFDSVKVYYFQRQQGFSCVPSAGGCTLGMSAQHIGFKTMTLAEHAAELRRAHRLQLQEINARGSSSDESEESEEDFLSEGSGSDLDAETNGFLQPVSPKQRRTLLKAAGVRKIDASEKIECRDIRNSREVCGCSCRDFCDPETCACSQSGIKCQVDRTMFPCGCSRDACGNTVGRVEFNPARVRTHFIHTIMRLEMENRQQQPHMHNMHNNNNNGNLNNYNMSPSHYYNQTQTASNYSSGYASPAYNTEAQSTGGYYMPQNHYGNYGVDSVDYGSNNHMYAHNYNEIQSTSYNNQYQVPQARTVSSKEITLNEITP